MRADQLNEFNKEDYEENEAVNLHSENALELAKEFGDDNSSKFINGVLSNVAEKKLNLELKNKNDQPKVSTK